MAATHVFLSYCRDNAKQVAKLRDDLLAAGEQVWWDQQILPGQDWQLAIRQATTTPGTSIGRSSKRRSKPAAPPCC